MKWIALPVGLLFVCLFLTAVSISGRPRQGGDPPSKHSAVPDDPGLFRKEIESSSATEKLADISGSEAGKLADIFEEKFEPDLIREVTFHAGSKQNLRFVGVDFLGATGKNRVLVRLPRSRLLPLSRHPGVREVSVPRAVVAGLNGISPENDSTMMVHIYRGVGLQTVQNRLPGLGIQLLNSFPGINTMVVKGSKSELLSLAEISGVQAISPLSEIESTNAGCAGLSKVDIARTGSTITGPLSGAGITAGIWDGGPVDLAHPDLAGRIDNMIPGSYFSYHATHVSGTILGSGAGYADTMGMAPGAKLKAWTYQVGAFGVYNQWMEFADQYQVANNSWGMVTGWRAPSYSGGIWGWYGGAEPDKEDPSFGRYSLISHAVDEATASDQLIIVCSAGNDRNDAGPGGGVHWHAGQPGLFFCEHPKDGIDDDDLEGRFDGFDTLPPNAVAKNPIVVGAVDKNGLMSPFSSWGATDDGRIKPDLVAGGVQVISTLPNGGYGSFSGTSMATPVVTGSIALLLEQMKIHGYPFEKPPLSMVKALLIHTALDLDTPGPDYKTGWGLLDTKAAVDLVDADVQSGKLSRIKFEGLNDGEALTASFYAEQGDPLQVTIAWSDLPGPMVGDLPTDDPGEGSLMNDLDLQITGPVGGELFGVWNLDLADPRSPATRNGKTNYRDNVEQIRIDSAPVSGIYTVRISHKGALHFHIGSGTDYPVQPFSLISGHVLSDMEPEEEALPGDLTGDGLVNVLDLQKMILILNKMIELTRDLVAVADLSGDGKVNIVDFFFLMKLIQGS